MSNEPTAISDREVVALAKQILQHSREDIERSQQSPRDANAHQRQQQPGITVDLGYKKIQRLPEEVIDVIRAEIERLAIAHNLLTTVPSRLVECKRLRYLNVRYNQIRELPDAILGLPSLEILDISRNLITAIPPGIAQLTSLKVLAMAKNRVEELPVSLGDINTLKVLKLEGNPIRFPPPEICGITDNVPSPANEIERDTQVASHVKRFMRQWSEDKHRAELEKKQRTEREQLRIESSGDESWTESNPETPRPSRRAHGTRFPVRPSIGSADGFGQPSPGLPPTVNLRPHSRTPSSPKDRVRRPQLTPLILTNGPLERNRSQSEGFDPATQRQKRMGIYSKASNLGSVDELKGTTHFRGFSQGYVVSGGGSSNGVSIPATAIGYGDSKTARPYINRPLSDVREHKRRSRAPDVVVEAARGFLYAISQLHDPLARMMRTIRRIKAKEGSQRREFFHRHFVSTYLQLRQLDELLRKFDTLAEEDEADAHRLSKSVYFNTLKCIHLFMHVPLAIAENREEIAQHIDPRILRSYLLLHQGSVVEIRLACSTLGAVFSERLPASHKSTLPDFGATVRASAHRTRPSQMSPPQRRVRYQTPTPVSLHSYDESRSNTLTSICAATPRSAESFTTAGSSMTKQTSTTSFDEREEDRHFEIIYGKLRTACDKCKIFVPQITRLMKNEFEVHRDKLDSDDPKMKVLMGLIEKAINVQDSIVPLSTRLSQLQVNDSYSRSQPVFWQQCMAFLKAWFELAAASVGDGRHMGLLKPELKQTMKSLHKYVKEASAAINDSPWSHLTTTNQPAPNTQQAFNPPPAERQNSMSGYWNTPGTKSSSKPMTGGQPYPAPINTSITSVASTYSHPYSTSSLGSGSGGYGTPVPATPLLNAALGAAAQATVPNTPGYSRTGTVMDYFERPERLRVQKSSRRG
ncbi:hypothetical protein M011DRAFT_412755 [Sporormia fimetaria CBS 119925]|uniref:Disease resistance R13L4/SHOC-2-like LRR domain-containing protein n=1 Tax=Sporormia fimetaria CBS 119925 TaxID=1340428 RepID=A0A6A6UY64_9PLEO|nr:hypothetical protein M011DRAFT_412755 [Sporormia fimetaria CBS 119925]